MTGPVDRPAPPPLPPVTPDPWTHLAGLTPARLALGRSGASLPSREVLKLGLAHAKARDAVHAAMDGDALANALAGLGRDTVTVESAAPDRATYLRRPDFGRRLSARSRALLSGAGEGVASAAGADIAVVVADGLSASAVDLNAVPLIEALLPRFAGRSLAPVVLAHQARVALGDEVGALLGARLVVMLIGERPGLSAADSLGAYLTYGPRVGLTDAARNCVSNIRAAGLGPDAAAAKIAWLVDRAFALSLTGVALKDGSDAAELPMSEKPRLSGN
ncbi:ethanolamine ammonia-lyase subunit EutC [Lichenibacterium ramalinae]|uniref:Ethanolamine ammonia-lyase small subunit n=1 Tax=Lichenibacterium ramalinae TaxID=2316527 RepID=A0A4Q2RFF1_9HYPH|nr:ethanolamine ammonia-lyase subunit EutC [Lichenibacterium ramalinae]RYB05609.1 ethanolamine ammonia-lyase subunit EutC [Lichenibacterium ramalinae]